MRTVRRKGEEEQGVAQGDLWRKGGLISPYLIS